MAVVVVLRRLAADADTMGCQVRGLGPGLGACRPAGAKRARHVRLIGRGAPIIHPSVAQRFGSWPASWWPGLYATLHESKMCQQRAACDRCRKERAVLSGLAVVVDRDRESHGDMVATSRVDGGDTPDRPFWIGTIIPSPGTDNPRS